MEQKLRNRGYVDLQYHFNVNRDPNSLSTGRDTNSTEPSFAGQASKEYSRQPNVEIIHTAPVNHLVDSRRQKHYDVFPNSFSPDGQEVDPPFDPSIYFAPA